MIEGLSGIRRCPRLGALRLGIKTKNSKGVEYPKEVDYFVLDPNTGSVNRDQVLRDQFKDLYGEKPKSIKIMFPPTNTESFMQLWYKRYGKSALLKCKGTGKTATCATKEFAEGLEIVGETDMGMTIVKCEGPNCIYQKDKSCHRLGTIQVLLPELNSIGVWQISTGSFNNIVNMNSAVDWIAGLCGRYSMIPINLLRVPQTIAYEGKKSTHYILQVDMNTPISALQRAALVAPERSTIGVLPSPDEKKDDLLYVDVENGSIPTNELTVEKALKETKGRIVGQEAEEPQLKEKSVDDYGDLNRFPEKYRKEARKIITEIKKGRKALGEERFLTLLGGSGWGSIAQIINLGPLKDFFRAMLCEYKAQKAALEPTKEQQDALGVEPEEA